VYAGSGNDVIEADGDEGVDTVSCGDGRDQVSFDGGVDKIAADCEEKDPASGTPINVAGTQVTQPGRERLGQPAKDMVFTSRN
jgi:hypothetical protein